MPAKSLREPTSHPLIIKADDYEEIVKKIFQIFLVFNIFYFFAVAGILSGSWLGFCWFLGVFQKFTSHFYRKGVQ
jgi:hypothetical protein